ncbi:MAG: hypothetical protein ABIQ31_08330 [Ferruginibacter sp.]
MKIKNNIAFELCNLCKGNPAKLAAMKKILSIFKAAKLQIDLPLAR